MPSTEDPGAARIAAILRADAGAMAQLAAVRALALPDACTAAGFLRNRVWDHLHGIAPSRPPPDIDVIYFDAADPAGSREPDHEAALAAVLPGLPWQVRNQARMHIPKNLPPHRDTAEAMTFWLESVTPVGARLESDDRLTIVAPLGTDDLLNLVCRPTAWGRRERAAYEARIAAKRWRELWPRVRFLE
ncbi:MAG: nucleotidyltransferase family protein [Alphaproteobacteria bacterium]|nr:nucleotidyltransferase family protein [Alphaproteobacteria bacterium]